MNKQGPGTNIDWTDWSVNPISGCLHGCDYCYLKRMKKFNPDIFVPKFHPERLAKPMKKKKPFFIFVGSASDMWGEWVKPEWIDDVLDVCHVFAPQHTYQFLTKNPQRYKDFKPLDNCWYGTTVDGTEKTESNYIFLSVSVPDEFIKFVSFEPLLEPIDPDLSSIDWVIIGANSNEGATKPPKRWADIIIKEARAHGIPVWMKDNYGYPERIKERPEMS